MKKTFLCMALLAAALPAWSQDWAKQRIEKSPRHREWVSLKCGSRTVNAFVVYPEVKSKAPAVVVIHEIYGLSDWAQLLTDELAAAGIVAIAPDLLSGVSGLTDSNAIGKAIRDLPPDQITADLNAAVDYVSKLPAVNGKVAVAGFCWGGGQSFRFATNRPSLAAAYVFYGPPPDSPDAVAAIRAPVYGFYAGNDARIDATIPKTQDMMRAAGKTYEVVTYDGAGHGFMRAGEAPDATPENKKARDEAWVRWKKLLKNLE
jgi:carboxymethylenebutenolidase